MSWKLRLLVPALLLAPQAAFSLGLGDIRLSSSLNEPLTAEIDLLAATPDEVSTLKAQLASRDMFQRYGLDRPSFLDGVEFEVGKGPDGRSVLLVKSRNPIGEPFVTFLVEVNWPRGRLLREYTVLLDPPVFAPKSAEPAAVAAPRVQAPASRPATASVAAPVSPPPAPRTADTQDGASSYRVQRGDTLYQVAGDLSSGGRDATHSMMIAMYRANPHAFNGNINLLRAGTILRVPSADETGAVGAGEAANEISRQNREWRSGAGSGSGEGRLRLVTPEEGSAPAASARGDGTVTGQIAALEEEITEQRRLLELRNRDLAALQQQLAADQAAAAAAAAAPAPAPVADTEPEVAVSPEDDPGSVQAPEATPAPVEAAPRTPKPAAADAAVERSFFDSLSDNWLYVLGAAGLLFGGLLGYGYLRRRREDDLDDALRKFDIPMAPDTAGTARLRKLEPELAPQRPSVEVIETPPTPAPERRKVTPAPVAAEPFGHDQTISAEAALDLDTADPLAEADFHMAYGLYDQAADLVRMAISKEPKRHDLKMKLAEIHFVAGDEEQFMDAVRDLDRNRAGLASGDWDRIVIMGRQISADDPLFAAGVGSGRVDLSLEGGDGRVDLELLAPPGGDEGIDLDLGDAFGATTDSDDDDADLLDFEFDGGTTTSTDTTREMEKPPATNTVEMPTLELPTHDAPTVETPILRDRSGDTMREKISSTSFASSISPDATAEMAIDDLGLDLSDLDDLGDDATRLMPGGDVGDDTGTVMMPDFDSEGTSEMPALKSSSDDDVDFDLTGGDVEVDGGDTHVLTGRNPRLVMDELPGMTSLEPVTMSEVGTKLDLARAYMDMGDPDGARNILEEVLAEGSNSQKQEARRLIESLPGA